MHYQSTNGMLGKQHHFTPSLQFLPKSLNVRLKQVNPIGHISTLIAHVLSVHRPQNCHLGLITGETLPRLEWVMNQEDYIRYRATQA